MCQCAMWLVAVILLTLASGITTDSHAALCHIRFCSASESTSRGSTRTCGGDAFITRLAKNHRFDSSGLNLAFEGPLLGESLRVGPKGTYNNPQKLGF
jgi:hypothetical protein